MPESISTLIGILLDVSGSMKESVGGGVQEEGRAWIQSIFPVIDDLIKYDLSSSNLVFALGVGASCGNGIFDLISTLKQLQNRISSAPVGTSYDDVIRRIIVILEDYGPKVGRWATKSVIESTISFEIATLLLRVLESDPVFVRSFMDDIFRQALRSGHRTAREEDLIEVVEKAKGMMLKNVSVGSSIFSVQKNN